MANSKATRKNGNIHPTRIFKTPDELLQAWIKFKEDIIHQSQEWIKVQYVGKEGERKEDAMKIPLTLEGFERFCYTNYGCVEQYFHNQDKLYNDFITVCSRIKREIRENQIIGGMLGVFNPSITQRLNGLTEKTDVTSAGEKIEHKTNIDTGIEKVIELINKKNEIS